MEKKGLLETSESETDDEDSLLNHNALAEYSAMSKGEIYQVPFTELARFVKHGNIPKIKEAMKQRDVQLSDSIGWTVVHLAATTNDVEVMSLLLNDKRCSVLLNRQDQTGATPMISAVQANCVGTLELLCSRGADPSKTLFKTGETALHLAATGSETQAARIVLQHNTSSKVINYLNYRGDTALTDATRANSPVFHVLLDAGADITVKNPENGRTLLHIAVAYNRKSMLRTVLQHKHANFDFAEVKDVSGDTALMIAVRLQNFEAIVILTSSIENLTGINTAEHESALHIAISLDRPDILTHLVQNTSSNSVDYFDIEQRNPVLYAAELDNKNCLQKLIEFGADFRTKNPSTGETVMHVVARHHSNSTLPYLIKLPYIDWFFNQKDHFGSTPFITAILSGNDKFLRESLKIRKMDFGEYSAEGDTPIYYTVKHGYPHVLMTLLLSPKYYSFAKDYEHILDLQDPLVILRAEMKGDIYATDVYILLKIIIKNSLVEWFPHNLVIRSTFNRSVFHACALGGNLECLEFLYRFYKIFAPKQFMDDFDTKGRWGNTPMLLAARCGPASVPCFNFFATHGADLSATNEEGVSVISAIFSYNPNASDVLLNLFNHCVSAKRGNYVSERLGIMVDFGLICPINQSQLKIVNKLINETEDESDRRKVLQHPVINLFLKKKLWKVRKLFYFRFIVSCSVALIASVLIPFIYIGQDSKEHRFELPLSFAMRMVVPILIVPCIINVLFRISAVMNKDVWCSDFLQIIPPIAMILLLVEGKFSFFAPELAAATILSCWTCVLLISINIYSTFNYELAVFFRLILDILRHMIVLTAILFAFSISFFCLYHGHEMFDTFSRSFIYTFTVMLPGTVSRVPTLEKGYFTNTSYTFHFLTECFILAAFILVALISIINMIIDLAIRGGRTLEEDGNIYKYHHMIHYLRGVEYWCGNRLYYWLIRKDLFSFIRDWQEKVSINLAFDLYADESNSIQDTSIIPHFRTIVQKRMKRNAKDTDKEVFYQPNFGYLPGAESD
uniref:Uncharacterized protein n=1 Tax=Graphocephala atropunctata TaxID=36148 RepID=A0A1B6MMD9_9HEMI